MEFMSSLQNGVDDHKPSLFELLSEQQLSSLLPPSIRYLLAILTQRYPRYLLRALNSYDELYALLSLVVERHYLHTYGGSFTENFYGLKRERVLRIKGGEVPRAQIGSPTEVREALKLRSSDVWKNLAVMVGLPYLRYKLDEGYDIHAAPSNTLLFGSGPQYNRDILPPDATLKQRFMYYYKWFLRNVYPSLNAAYYFSVLAFNLAYLFDNSKYSSPFLWLIGTRLRRLGQADHRAIALATNPPPQPSSSRPGETTSIFHPRTIYPRLLSSLRILLPTSIFALKFLEWWHASDFSRQLTAKAAEGLDLPPPVISGLPSKTQPSKLQAEDSAKKQSKKSPPVSSTSYLPIFTVPLPKPAQSSLCPICLHALSNPAAVQTGYVFDYVCIFKWVEGTHERQEMFMSGEDEGVWGDDDDEEESDKRSGKGEQKVGSREGKWESGKGRCAVTGRRVLGGTEGIRRVMV